MFKGLAAWAIANNATIDKGVAFVVNVGGHARCVGVEAHSNSKLCSGVSGACPGIRFLCDGDCGLVAIHPSKRCRTIDRQGVSLQGAALPSGVQPVKLAPGSVLPSGIGGGSILSLPSPF